MLLSVVRAESRCLFHTQNKLFPCSQGRDTSLPHIHLVNVPLQLLKGRKRPGTAIPPQLLIPRSEQPLCCRRAAQQSGVPWEVKGSNRVELAAGSTSAGCAREKKKIKIKQIKKKIEGWGINVIKYLTAGKCEQPLFAVPPSSSSCQTSLLKAAVIKRESQDWKY